MQFSIRRRWQGWRKAIDVSLVLRLVALVTVAAFLLVLIPELAYASPETLTLRPDAAGDLTQWDLGAGASNYQAVNEASPDDDTTYVYQSATSDEDDLYNIGTAALLAEVPINSVTVYAVAKSVESGSGRVDPQPFYILVKSGGTIYPDGGRTPTTSYVEYSNTWSLNPDGDVAWTKAAIDELQVGIRGRTDAGGASGRHEPRVTQVYVLVDYTPPWESYHADTGGTADSGTINTLTDDALTQADDYWTGAWLEIVTTTDELAPEGESQPVTDFIAATDTLYTDNFSAAIDAGDTYMLYTAWGTTGTQYDGDSQTVYMYGENFAASQLYHVGLYDPSVAPNKVASTDPTSTAAGNLETQYLLTTDPEAEAGTWHAVVYKDPNTPPTSYTASDPNAAADDDFEVSASAIPEFPTIVAAIGVAGLCFGIYYWMRKRRLAYVKA